MAGYSIVELLFVLSALITAGGIAVPQFSAAVEDARAVSAARYVAATLQRARMEAILRSADVGLRVATAGATYEMTRYVDGNGDGIRSLDIQHGVDRQVGAAERLGDRFPGVEFGAAAGLPAVDAGSPPGSDPIRLGASNIASFTATGTSTSGSLYIKGGHDRQFVVRIFGDTGKTRILKYASSTRTWRPL